MVNEKRDLIDRKDLAEILSTLTMTITGLRAGKGVLYEFMKEYRKSVLRIVDETPTVDAVEVVHGRWILKSRIYKMFDDVDEEFYVECNLCNREEPVCFEFGEQQMLDYAKRHYPYCHCGAKMDGGIENDI